MSPIWRDIFFTGILRKEGHPQELSFLRKQEHSTYFRQNRSYNCRFRPLHYYFGFPVIELSVPAGLTKHPVCHLFSGKCADQAYPLHIPAFLFSDRERSLFCRSSKHNPPKSFSLSVLPSHRGISPYAPH